MSEFVKTIEPVKKPGRIGRTTALAALGIGLFGAAGCAANSIDGSAKPEDVAAVAEAYGWDDPQVVGETVYVSCDSGTTFVANTMDNGELGVTVYKGGDNPWPVEETYHGGYASKSNICSSTE